MPTVGGCHAGRSRGILVVDLTRVLGGPYCTQILGDHGAEVIKVEPPQGDEVRDWGPPFDAARDASYFIGVNRNKRSLGLDLARPEGRDVLLRLLERADVLIENYKPGAMEKWGLGYEDVLRARFPRLIHCRISGFGADGPMGGLPGLRRRDPGDGRHVLDQRHARGGTAGRPGSASRWSTSAPASTPRSGC